MQTRNLVLFFALTLTTLILWNNFVMPKILPRKPPVAKNAVKKDEAAAAHAGAKTDHKETGKPGSDQLAAAKPGADKSAAEKPGTEKSGSGKPGSQPEKAQTASAVAAKGVAAQGKDKSDAAKPAAEVDAKIPVFERKSILLGSSDPDTGYFFQAELTTKGGAVSSIEFNDPRYRELSNTKIPLKLVGNDADQRMSKALGDRILAQSERDVAAERLRAAQSAVRPGDASSDVDSARAALEAADEKLKQAERDVSLAQTTFNTDFPEFDALFPKDESGLSARNWKVAEVKADPDHPGVNSSVTFEFPSPDGKLILEKRYSLEAIKGGAGTNAAAREVRDNDTAGYLLHLDIKVQNAGARQSTLTYTLQGPVGLPLEDAANARKLRDLKMGFLLPTGGVNAQTKTVSQVLSDEQKNKVEEWKSPLKYIGVDVQYFTALILPTDNQLKDRTIERSQPMLIEVPADKSKKAQADLSVQLDSTKVVLGPNESVTHHFELFAGPKRKTLLATLQAEGVLDFGWFAQISNAMLWVLNIFHGMGLPYGVAIICLTVLVRACMFPVSLRQTAQQQRMKEMQPKLSELKKKYADNKEKLAMANLELMREYKVNPMAGCLPLVIQMPIFLALYQALQYSVDLRLAPFLYFNNLAAPDALFKLPFIVPWLGWTTFNLLPIVTVVLMVVQQKMFMPPPTDEQGELQQKMMSYMMVVMGAMFYKFPAGLCVYYISSSLWGFGERKLLLWWKPATAAPPSAAAPAETEEAPAAGRGKPAQSSAPETTGRVRQAAGSFWQKLLDAADAANSDAAKGSKAGISRRRSHPAGKRNGKRPR